VDAALVADRLRQVFARDAHGAVAVYLFGSLARELASPRSDIDVAVLFQDAPPATLDGFPAELLDALEQAAAARVDLVVLNTAPVDLVHRVLRDGLLVFEADRAARVRFEVRARNEYFDLLPVLEEYRRPRRGSEATR